MFYWKRFFYIETGECHKNICLEECDKELKKPKWKSQKSKYTSPKWRNCCSQIHNNRNHDCSDEDIEKQTEWEWSNSDKFTEKMKPSDHNIYYFLKKRIPTKIPKIMVKVMNRSLHNNPHSLCYQDNCQWHKKRCTHVRIHRAKICVKWWNNNSNQIQYKSNHVPKKNNHSKTSKKPHVSSCLPSIFENSSEICENTSNNIKWKSLHTGHLIGMKCIICYSYKQKKKHHKNPCGKNSIRNSHSSDIPSFYRLSFWCWDMWTRCMCFIARRWMYIRLSRYMHCYLFGRCSPRIRDECQECKECHCTIDNSYNHRSKSLASIWKHDFFASWIFTRN